MSLYNSKAGQNVVFVLHEYGANSHYTGLVNVENCEVQFFEFSIFKLLVKGLVKRDLTAIYKQFKNFAFLISLPFRRRSDIVVGIAPFDFRMLLIELLTRKHRCIYHTSWANWGEFFPKKFHPKPVMKSWQRFLHHVDGVACVTNSVKKSISLQFPQVAHKCELVFHSVRLEDGEHVSEKKYLGLFVGRVEVSKGIIDVLRLAHFFPERKFAVAGRNIAKIDFSEYPNVDYLGYFSSESRLVSLYKTSMFFLAPSKKTEYWEELFGLSIIEAMALGCVPFCSNHPGPREILGEAFSELLFSEEDFVSGVKEAINSQLKSGGVNLDLKLRLYEESQKYSKGQISKKWLKILSGRSASGEI